MVGRTEAFPRHGGFMKRKILVWPSTYPTEASFVSGIFTREQAEVLSRRYDVAVAMARVPSWRLMLKGRDRPRTMEGTDNGLPMFRQEAVAPPRSFFLRVMFYRLLAERLFARVIDRWGRPDLVHAYMIYPAGWTAVRIAGRHGIPVVLTEYTGPFSVHLETRLQQRLARETLDSIHHLVTASPGLAREVESFCPVRRVSPLGIMVKTAFFVPPGEAPPPGERTRFLTVALLDPAKGIHNLIEALHLLAKKGYTNCELWIGGDGPARSSLEAQARRLGVESRCRFLGLLKPDEVKSWMQRCDVFVLPSLVETFGVVIGEAMACGKPVIATRCTGPEFIITEENGLLVGIDDSEDLAAAMEKVLTGGARFEADAVRRSVTSRFGEEVYLENLSRIYESVLAEKGRR
jgi:glycosyltransferase involved in cell wall biosynthesis